MTLQSSVCSHGCATAAANPECRDRSIYCPPFRKHFLGTKEAAAIHDCRRRMMIGGWLVAGLAVAGALAGFAVLVLHRRKKTNKEKR